MFVGVYTSETSYHGPDCLPWWLQLILESYIEILAIHWCYLMDYAHQLLLPTNCTCSAIALAPHFNWHLTMWLPPVGLELDITQIAFILL
jgi:hypothetical protein